MHRRTLLKLAAGMIAAPLAPAKAADGPTISLKRGVNLSHWLAQAKRYRHDPNYHKPEHFLLMRRLGLDHVRLSIDPEPLTADDGSLREDFLGRITGAIRTAAPQQVRVVIDLHPEPGFKKALTEHDDAADRFIALWKRLATQYGRSDPTRVCFEIMNEPMIENTDRWNTIQHATHKAIREATPEHTIILTGPRWSSADQVPFIKPVNDANVLYTFHFYEPFHFTHQGSTWTTDWLRQMHGLPYPSSPEAVEPALAAIPDGEPRHNARWYGQQRWDRAKLSQQFDAVHAWASKQNASIYLGEFGALRTHAPRGSRLRWHRDVRELVEARGWGWCLWDFADAFGLCERKGAQITPDAELAEALGLNRL